MASGLSARVLQRNGTRGCLSARLSLSIDLSVCYQLSIIHPRVSIIYLRIIHLSPNSILLCHL